MRDMMSKLKLTVNETKTRVCQLPEEKFDFLGYTFGRCYSPRTGRAYLGTVPVEETGAAHLSRRSATRPDGTRLWQDPKTIVDRLNRMMIGWANYFCLGPVSKAYRAVDTTRPPEAASVAVRQTQRAAAGDTNVFRKRPCTQMLWLGPAYHTGPRAFRGRKRESFSESRMREIRLSGSMSGNRKQNQAKPD